MVPDGAGTVERLWVADTVLWITGIPFGLHVAPPAAR